MIDAVSVSPELVESRSRPAAPADDGFGFDDFLDIINPLQHIPLIGTAYRAITGDEMETPARLAGGALYGGLFGFLGALGTTVLEEITGESVDQKLASLFDGSSRGADPYRAHAAYASAQALAD